MLSAAKFWWLMLLYSGRRFNLCCNGTLSIVTSKRWYMYFEYSLRIGFKGFSSFLKSFLALFWRGRKVLHVSSHPLLWQLHLMSAKWSESILCCGLPVGDRGEVIPEWEQWSHVHICWGEIPACLVCFRQLDAWLRSQIRAVDPPRSPIFKQQGEDSAGLPSYNCSCRVCPQIVPSLPGTCLTEGDHSG